MDQWITEYANAADHGAPYAGPVILASTVAVARQILGRVRGPNGEVLQLKGRLLARTVDASRIGDTFSIVDTAEGDPPDPAPSD